MDIISPDSVLDVFQKKGSVLLVAERMGMNPRKTGCPSYLIQEGMRPITKDHLVASAAVRQDSQQVPHCPRGDEKAGFHCHSFSCKSFQIINGRIFPIHIIANFCVSHRPAHGGRRLRNSI